MKYKLWLSTGSQEGPYHTVFAAKLAALTTLSGHVDISYIEIRNHSINDEVVARITRKDYYMVADELGQVKSKETAKINMAQFEVKATVILYDVKSIELENSEVLHPDVLKQLERNLEDGIIRNVEITLDEVFELTAIKD